MQKTEIIIYDLNNTLYLKSSKSEFYKFILKRKSWRIIFAPQLLFVYLLKNIGLMRLNTYKENFFGYLNHLTPVEVKAFAQDFWKREFDEKFNQQMLRDIKKYRKQGIKVYIITGALELYTEVLLNFIKMDGLLGTRSTYKNNKHKVIGKACKKEEKIRRLDEAMGNQPYILLRAFSDADEPILYEAREGYYVKDGQLLRVN